jgi:hypothetical protein
MRSTSFQGIQRNDLARYGNRKTSPQMNDDPAINNLGKILPAFFQGFTGSPHSREIRDFTVVRFFIIDEFIRGRVRAAAIAGWLRHTCCHLIFFTVVFS